MTISVGDVVGGFVGANVAPAMVGTVVDGAEVGAAVGDVVGAVGAEVAAVQQMFQPVLVTDPSLLHTIVDPVLTATELGPKVPEY